MATKPTFIKFKAFRDANKGRPDIIRAISDCTFSSFSSSKAEHPFQKRQMHINVLDV